MQQRHVLFVMLVLVALMLATFVDADSHENRWNRHYGGWHDRGRNDHRGWSGHGGDRRGGSWNHGGWDDDWHHSGWNNRRWRHWWWVVEYRYANNTDLQKRNWPSMSVRCAVTMPCNFPRSSLFAGDLLTHSFTSSTKNSSQL